MATTDEERVTKALGLLRIANASSDRPSLLIIIATALDALGDERSAWPLLREAGALVGGR